MGPPRSVEKSASSSFTNPLGVRVGVDRVVERRIEPRPVAFALEAVLAEPVLGREGTWRRSA